MLRGKTRRMNPAAKPRFTSNLTGRNVNRSTLLFHNQIIISLTNRLSYRCREGILLVLQVGLLTRQGQVLFVEFHTDELRPGMEWPWKGQLGKKNPATSSDRWEDLGVFVGLRSRHSRSTCRYPIKHCLNVVEFHESLLIQKPDQSPPPNRIAPVI